MSLLQKYDVFLSRKKDDAGLSRVVFDFLSAKGFKVFDSDISLQEIGNSDYSRAIDDALTNTRHLVVIGSSVENIAGSWVEAEWRFFLNRKRAGKIKGNLLTVITEGVDVHELPPSLQNFEAISFKDLERLIPYLPKEQEVSSTKVEPVIESQPVVLPPENIPESKPSGKSPTKTPGDAKKIDSPSEKTNGWKPKDRIALIISSFIMVIVLAIVFNSAGNTESDSVEEYYEVDSVAVAEVDTAAVSYEDYGEFNFDLGKYYYDKGEFTKALEFFRSSADNYQYGHSQNYLGFMYQHGYGVEVDYQEALRWYKLAADQNISNAQVNIGKMYYLGEGVESNLSTAKIWFQMAADLGDEDADEWLKQF